MQNLINNDASSRVRYCFTLAAQFIPNAILEEDKALQRVVRRSGQCFAYVACQSRWNAYQICIAATPHHLHDDEQSHMIHVPATALPVLMDSTTLVAEAIPEELLLEDKELCAVVQKDGKCWAWVEHQVDWDCYRLRIAARQEYLHDKERSYVIFVSAMQLQGPEGSAQEVQCRTKKDVLQPAGTQVEKKHIEGRKTHTICISEAELLSATRTMDSLEENVQPEMCKPSLKPRQRVQQWIDLLLFRAALIALKYRESLQQVIRQVLVWRGHFRERLIRIKGMYEEDHQMHWVVQIKIPSTIRHDVDMYC